MRRALLWLALASALGSCRPSKDGGHVEPSPSKPRVTPATAPSADAASAGPPAVERACARDEDCAVARVEISGREACCAACGTTPGTRHWRAELEWYCARHPPPDCPPLACPMGPTRAVCRAGVCEATPDGADGGPAFVADEQRCLPALVCDTWQDCVELWGNPQDGFYVRNAPRIAAGSITAVEKNVCTAPDAGRCEAAVVVPRDRVCPPHSEPPLIAPPPYSCRLRDGRCVRS